MTALIVGVTGKIGSGKSTACTVLKEHLEKFDINVAIMNCDYLFKAQVSNTDLYNESFNRLLGIVDREVLSSSEKLNHIIRMNKSTYIQFIHNINAHMYPIFSRFANDLFTEVVLVESAYILDTPMALQCNHILELKVSRTVREQRVINRDGNIRSNKATMDIFDLQDKFLKNKYRASLKNIPDILSEYYLTKNETFQYIALDKFLLNYTNFLKTKIDLR